MEVVEGDTVVIVEEGTMIIVVVGTILIVEGDTMIIAFVYFVATVVVGESCFPECVYAARDIVLRLEVFVAVASSAIAVVQIVVTESTFVAGEFELAVVVEIALQLELLDFEFVGAVELQIGFGYVISSEVVGAEPV